MEAPKKKAKKTKAEASGAAGGTAERSGSAATDGTAELTRAAWAIARVIGGIWGELKKVKEDDESDSLEESEDGEENMEVDTSN